MRYTLATLGLGPLIYFQGHRIRKVIPKLSEPTGKRSGIKGSGPRLRLLIAGDSAAAGVGVRSQQEALAGSLVSHLSGAYRVHWQIIARTGHTAGDVLAHLESAPAKPFDVAFLSVGVNDVTKRTGSANWIRNQRKIIALLKGKFGVRHVLYSNLPPMHRFQVLPQPLRWYVGMRAKELDRLLHKTVEADAQCAVINIVIPTASSFFAADGFHPSQAAYWLWGRQAATAIKRRLSMPLADGHGS